jgi:hypothetical protein
MLRWNLGMNSRGRYLLGGGALWGVCSKLREEIAGSEREHNSFKKLKFSTAGR